MFKRGLVFIKKNIIHFTPEKNWMNDPNGLVYFEEEYHLFYQYYPEGIVWGPMHWGHAVSKNLITWENLDIALYPDENGYIFSGSVVVDKNNSAGFSKDPYLVAIFTHHSTDNIESQSIAYSLDKGRTWIKYEGNPVIKNPSIKDFRDPKVMWHRESNRWIMVLSSGIGVRFYSSLNLKEWNYESEFIDSTTSYTREWECPELIKMNIKGENEYKYVLKVDVGGDTKTGGSAGIYFIGDFDGHKFICEEGMLSPTYIDCSQDFYASQSWFNSDRRNIWLGWLVNWDYAKEVPCDKFRGIMSFPRQIELRKIEGKYILAQRPVDEIYDFLIESFNCNKMNITDTIINSESKVLLLEIEILKKEFKQFKIIIDFYEENAILSFTDKEIVFNRSNFYSSDFSEKYLTTFTKDFKINDVLDVKILCDVNSIEIFILNGTIVFSSLVLPKDKIKSVKLVSKDILEIQKCKLYTIKRGEL